MSTVTTFLNMVKPVTIEQFSLATYNSNLDKADLGVSKATPLFVSLNTSDTNWSYAGGLWIQAQGGGPALAHLNVRMVRIAGGTVALTTAMLQLAVPINAPYRPVNHSITRYSVLQEGPGHATPGADVWGVYSKIDKDGKLYMATNTGTASITVGRQFEVDMWWQV